MPKDKKKAPVYKYEVLEKNEENFKHSKLVKRNVDVEFTLADVESHEHQLRKQLKETEATITHRLAEMNNIEHFHPFVKEFDDKQLHTLALYAAAMFDWKKLEPIQKELANALSEYDKEKAAIYEQCGFEDEPVKGMTVEQVKQEKPSDESDISDAGPVNA